MLYKMIVNQLSAVFTLSALIFYSSLALDVCKDTDTANCQSCGDSVYPRDELYRENCMKSCGVCTGRNIALGKPTDQSSTLYNGSPSNAVDGNTDNYWASGQCTHTNNNDNEWWCVNLQQMYNIDYIKLFNKDYFKERLQGFEIKTSSSGTCNQVGFSSATLCYKDTTSTVEDIYTIERCNQPTSTSISARTVYVTVSRQHLTLCEVQIFSDSLYNVARDQDSVKQSSTRFDDTASEAVDGDTDSDYFHGSCAHTLEGQSGWWCVDLQQLYFFNQIKIYNRKDKSVWGRLQGFEIKTSSSDQCSGQGFRSAISCYKDTTSTGQSIYTVTGCNQGSSTPFSGRTVYVSSRNDALTLCEVEIFPGVAQCNYGYYRTSNSTCQPCNTCLGDTCDPSNGVCTGDCKIGFYGTRCQQTCSNQCLNNQCSKSDGRCNCKPDTDDPHCNPTCGTGCQPSTDQNSVTCDRTGKCTKCITGRYGDRCDKNCSMGCDGGCERGPGRCTNCIVGRYGERCDKNCSAGCDGGCDRNGRCTECIVGRYGQGCDMNCSTGCHGGCDRNGRCTNCITGRYGDRCDKNCSMGCDGGCERGPGRCTNCIVGRYGERCDKNCSAGCDGGCDRNGRCTECIVGRYGQGCDMNCSTGCDDGCDRGPGRCTNCIVGRYGNGCDKNCSMGCDGGCDRGNGRCTECIVGRYGDGCDKNCNTGCDGGCDRGTGRCTDCIKGRYGDMCSTDCEAGSYGDNCTSKCGNCADETPCDVITGSCGLVGCADGFQGPVCKEHLSDSISTALSPLVIGLIGVLVGVLCGILGTVAVFLLYYFFKKRCQSNNPKEDIEPDYVYSNTDLNPTTSTTDDTLTTGCQNIPTNTRNVDYVNHSFNTDDNTEDMYDTLDHEVDDTNNTYASI